MGRSLSDHRQDGNVAVGGIGNLAGRGPSGVSAIHGDGRELRVEQATAAILMELRYLRGFRPDGFTSQTSAPAHHTPINNTTREYPSEKTIELNYTIACCLLQHVTTAVPVVGGGKEACK